MSKNVLVTGSAGFAGAHVVEHLLKNTDWNIVGLDSFRHQGDSERVRHLIGPRYHMHTCDLSTPISERLVSLIGYVDYIVNLASLSHVDHSIENPVPFVQNNVNLSLSMLEYARRVEPKKFIQFGTDESYGPAKDHEKHVEWSAILPSNPYAASKACQEAIAISYWRTYGVPVMLTNTMNLIGERQDKVKFVPKVISKIMKGERITIHGSPGNIGSRHYIHARNVADALLFLLKEIHPATYPRDDRPSRFNIVGEIELDNLELAQSIAQSIALGTTLKYDLVDFHAARPGHDRRYALDGTKLASLGWKQPKNFFESLDKTVQWTLAHPEWLA